MSRVSPLYLLFDLDGVLVRTQDVWFRLLEEAGRRFRGSPVTREEFEPTFGQGTDADQRVFGLRCTPEELNRYYVENFHRHAGEVWTNPEARPTLEALRALGKSLAVVTNTTAPLAKEILARAQLSDLFAATASADQVARPKPAPDLLVHALDLLGAHADQAWMVGDSRYDREAAQAAGVFFVGLGTEGDLRIEHLRELPQHLR